MKIEVSFNFFKQNRAIIFFFEVLNKKKHVKHVNMHIKKKLPIDLNNINSV